jgi:hypothetical protein
MADTDDVPVYQANLPEVPPPNSDAQCQRPERGGDGK